MGNKWFDVIFIGSGPTAMFAALELVKLRPEMKIAIFEKGKLRELDDENKTSGWGGAGTFSDGKLNLTHKVGGLLHEFVGKDEFYRILNYVRSLYIDFGAQDELHNPDPVVVEGLARRASDAGFTLTAFPIHHLGTDRVFAIARNIYGNLAERGVQIFTDSPVSAITRASRGYYSVKAAGRSYSARKVVVAMGREGEDLWVEFANKLGIALTSNFVDIGFRIEVANDVLKEWVDALYEAKLTYRTSFDENVRTFCMCPSGEVVAEEYRGGIITTNGHSYEDPERHSVNTNFALLHTTHFTKPFKDSVGYGRKIAGLVNDLAGGEKVIIQRLMDLRGSHPRRSTWERIREAGIKPTIKEQYVEPGDLRKAIPAASMENLKEGLEALIRLIPALGRNNGNDTLLIGAEVKFYSARTNLTRELETEYAGLFVGGDVSGWIRGLAQASMSGVIIARAIAARK